MMEQHALQTLHALFEQHTYQNDETDYWFARDLMGLLGYQRWENFQKVVQKAMVACEVSKNKVLDHFRDVTKMVEIGSKTSRPVEDMILSRYACYLIAQNGDPKKEEIAFAMTYFATKTRAFELIEKRMDEFERLQARNQLKESEKQLASVLFQHGQTGESVSRIKSKGDKTLFGGYSTAEMKKKLSIAEKWSLADFLPAITIKAKDFANEITAFNVKKENLQSETGITTEHVKNNKDVRKLLLNRGIHPEELPAEVDIQQLEKKLKKETKQLGKESAIAEVDL